MASLNAIVATGGAVVILAALAGCRGSDHGAAIAPARSPVARLAGVVTGVPALVQVPPPPFSDGVFPCSECHAQPDLPPNRTRRVLVDAHDDIVLKHDEQHRWCLDCHDTTDRDTLHLANGDRLPFAESYTLCGQCHGEKARDWRAGVHGRRTGDWNGRKEYMLCVHCHDPHAPRFKALEPMPAPLRPSRHAVTAP